MPIRRNLPELYRGPLREISRLQRGIDRLFEDFLTPFTGFGGLGRELAFVPAVEVEEQEDRFVFGFDLPGVSKDDIDIQVRDNQLVISGERKIERERKEGAQVTGERIYGSFQRMFSLPSPVDAERVEANFQDGVLTVTIPKAAQAKPKQIEIKEQRAETTKPAKKEKKGETAA